MRIDGHFGRPKRWKKKGSGDTSKFNEKLIEKKVPVERKIKPKHYSVVQNHTVGLFEKNEKSMPNGHPKVVILAPKSVFGRPGVD